MVRANATFDLHRAEKLGTGFEVAEAGSTTEVLRPPAEIDIDYPNPWKSANAHKLTTGTNILLGELRATALASYYFVLFFPTPRRWSKKSTNDRDFVTVI